MSAASISAAFFVTAALDNHRAFKGATWVGTVAFVLGLGPVGVAHRAHVGLDVRNAWMRKEYLTPRIVISSTCAAISRNTRAVLPANDAKLRWRPRGLSGGLLARRRRGRRVLG
jgi:hypothetical protein